MAEHNETGKKGESIARHYLEQNGYFIRAVNWRFGNNEIDIIAENEKELLIVEVKTRSSFFAAEAGTLISKVKQRFLIRAANAYLQKNNVDKETRFDIVIVIIQDSKHSIQHIQDAFYPTL